MKTIHFVFLSIVFFGFYSCHDKNEVEIISSEDFFPKAERDYNYDEDVPQKETFKIDSFRIILEQTFPSIDFEGENKIKENKSLMMPDRMGYLSKKEDYFTIDDAPYQIVTWTFEDSTKTINAFYNWLDCYGYDCESVKINERKVLEYKEFIIWVSKGKITYLTSWDKLKLNEWQNILYPTKIKDEEWYYILYQEKGHHVKWLVSSTSEKQIEE